MTILTPMLPPAPPGVDPDVLVRINAFMNQAGPKSTLKCVAPIGRDVNAIKRKPPSLAQRDAYTANFVEKTQQVSTAQKTERREQLTQGNYDWIKEPPTHVDNKALEAASVDLPLAFEKPRSQTKELDERTPLLSPLTPPAASSITHCDCDKIGRKILARAVYPQRPPNRPPPLPPRLKIARQIEPPALVSLLSMLYILFISLFVDENKPELIEYSVGEVKTGFRVWCEMLVVEGNGPCQAPVPGLTSNSRRLEERVKNETEIIFVANLLAENERTDTRRVVPIAAKPRRVRELLRDEGVGDDTEDVYRREIKGAMRMLCAMQGV